MLRSCQGMGAVAPTLGAAHSQQLEEASRGGEGFHWSVSFCSTLQIPPESLLGTGTDPQCVRAPSWLVSPVSS